MHQSKELGFKNRVAIDSVVIMIEQRMLKIVFPPSSVSLNRERPINSPFGGGG